MQIAVDQIVPDPDQPRKHFESKPLDELRRSISSLGMINPLVVRPHPDERGKYMIVVGERRWRAAVASGDTTVDCTVRNDLSEQEARELQLSENYHRENVPPMEMGRAFLRYRQTFGVSQQELARRTGITPGTIHHYESLIRNLAPDLGHKVESGELTFKEARSIADIDGHDRQREIAGPFIAGALSSVYVEKIVSQAKKSPDKTIGEMIAEVVKGTRLENRSEAQSTPSFGFDPNRMESVILGLAGELDSLHAETIPEYRRLNLISALRILDSKVQVALLALSRSESSRLSVPRPLIRAARR